MAEEKFRVVITQGAYDDLREIAEYWLERQEPERGQKYTHDLFEEAVRELSNGRVARGGRHLVKTEYPEAQEILVFKRSYRIVYFLHESEGVVEVMRFWHSHRDEPFSG